MQLRDPGFGTFAVDVETRPDGVRIMVNRTPLGAYPIRITDHLDRWAAEAPNRVFVGAFTADGVRTATYAETRAAARAIGAGLLRHGCTAEHGVAILAENGIDHLLLVLGAMYAGVPAAPISPAYARLSTDFATLRSVVGTVAPRLLFTDDAEGAARALAAVATDDMHVLASIDALRATTPDAALERAHAAVTADTVAKILFTSGSTGAPKGVRNTHRMLCANQAQLTALLPFLASEPPTIYDWLPWNHTFGGNHNVHLVLAHGGTLWINAGKPTPALFDATIRGLRTIAPTIHFDVPRGLELLAEALRDDPDLARTFFSRLRVLFYAGAGITPYVWDALHERAHAAVGAPIPILTSLGSTETAPAAIAAQAFATGAGRIGVPLPGIEAKLVPFAGSFEIRLRGPNITPGYVRDAARTAAAFDEEGFYRMGDTARFVDERRPELGLVFDGRLADDFKLATGTWVRATTLRTTVLDAFAGLLADVVLSGDGRNEIAALAFPNVDALRALARDLPPDAPIAELVRSPLVHARVAAILGTLARTATGSASRVRRFLFLTEPPSFDAGEITDKNTLSVRTILARRAASADAAHARTPGPEIVTAD
jgi:feruloyl-CoA synthase